MPLNPYNIWNNCQIKHLTTKLKKKSKVIFMFFAALRIGMQSASFLPSFFPFLLVMLYCKSENEIIFMKAAS